MIVPISNTRDGKPYNYMEFQCDDESDVKDLPTNANGYCAIGSKAFVTATNNVYNLTNQNEWKLYGNTQSGGGSASFSVATQNDINSYLRI